MDPKSGGGADRESSSDAPGSEFEPAAPSTDKAS